MIRTYLLPRVAPLTLIVLIAGSWLAHAGDLNPPAGPIQPTMKPLDEVEPRIAINATNTPGDADSLFKITQPGSYYLTGNITGVVGKHGIEIVANGVTLDLNGFDLVGVPGMGAFDGVSATAAVLTNIAVVNGSVRNWGDEGVDLGAFQARNCRVEGVLASGNIGNGIVAFNAATITNCAASLNTATGLIVAAGCTVTECSAYLNTGNGISVGNGSNITNCAAHDNTLTGILTGTGCTVVNCSAYQNNGNGISTNNGCTVADCTAESNTLDGIRCTHSSVVCGNACRFNGDVAGDGAGIHATGSRNRIEGNNCTQADRGIDVDASGNFIVRNVCSGNTTDWVIVANNVFGPIIDRRAPASAAVSGFSATSSLGSTDANANFSY